ncbi:MAG: coiled-coil domain-containing protein [Dehalococcoidia bacterium]
MRKLLPILLILVLIPASGLAASCGGEEEPSPAVVPQSEYDQVVADRDAAEQNLAELQSELESSRERVSNLETKISELESELAAANERITTLQSRIEEGPVKSVLPTISVQDEEGWIVEISIEDVWEFKGIPDMTDGEEPWSALAFRATRLAISELWGTEVPSREDIQIAATGLPWYTFGVMNCFHYIKKLIRPVGENGTGEGEIKTLPSGDLDLKIADPWAFSIEGLSFTFTRKSTGEKIRVGIKDAAVPEKLMDVINPETIRKLRLGEATEEKTAEFQAAEEEFLTNILELPQDKLFSFERK